MKIDAPSFLRAIARRSIEAIAFFLPLVVLPWTVSPLEINKQVLFYLLVAICLIAWVGEALLTKKISFSLRKIWIPFLIFFAIVIISGAFSPDAYTSIFGQNNQEYTSVVTIVFALLLSFVAAQILDRSHAQRVMACLTVSGGVLAILGILPFFGVSSQYIPLNLVGTPNALAVTLLITVFAGAGLLLVDTFDRSWHRSVVLVATALSTITALTYLLAIDYGALWALAILGAMSFFGLAFLHPTLLTRPIRFILPMILLVSGMFFVVLPTMISHPLPAEVALSSSMTWDITRNAWKNGDWIIGTGPGTFVMNYSQYHGAELNMTSFWDTRFDRGSSALLTMFSTVGVFGSVALIVGVILVTVFAILAFRRAEDFSDFPALVVWILSLGAWCLYPQNMTLTVLFWLSFALVMRSIVGHQRTYSFSSSPRSGFAAAFLFVLSAVFVLTVSFATISKYRADIAFAQAVRMSENGQSIDDIILALDRAATLNRWSDVYYRNLGSALLQKVLTLAADADADPEMVKSLIGAAVNASIRATELGPDNVTNWELRGNLYREVSPLVADAATFSLAAYQNAITLAPNNPKYLVLLSRGFFAYADVLAPMIDGDDAEKASQAKIAQDDALQRATDSLLSAITLKSDYAEARYYLAAIQERQGKLADAVASLELVRIDAPTDVGVGLQLSLLYMRQGKNDVAQKELERIIALAPNFANAHWYLAAVLEEADDIDGALMELEIIMSIDPGNETVQKKIDALRAGQVVPPTVPDPLPSTETSPLPDATTS